MNKNANACKLNLVAIGGGTGLSTLLEGIKGYNFNISAIVVMTDDGLSTGRLRKTFGILPPGDIRKSIIALAKKEDLLTDLFEYRFQQGKGLKGHSLGNLLLLALTKITGSFKKAVYAASEILDTTGKVIPATLDNINIIAYLTSGRKVCGERKAYLLGRKDPIKKVELSNIDAKANTEAVKAIKNADLILIGPGSLYSSLIPNFLIKSINKEILKNKKAKKIYICNVSTERGETQDYSVEDHIQALVNHSDPKLFSVVLVNNKIIKTTQKAQKLGEVHNITYAKNKFGRYKIIGADLIDKNKPLYHDSDKLGKVIVEMVDSK